MSKKKRSVNRLMALAIIAGIISGFLDAPILLNLADIIADVSIKIMKLISLPLLFLSVVSSASHFKDVEQVKKLGYRILRYTLLTTFIAALVAEGIFWLTSPYILNKNLSSMKAENLASSQSGFFNALLKMVPDNIVSMFLENNVLAVVVLGVVLALALLSSKKEEKDVVFAFFSGLLNAVMKIVHVIIKFIPVSIFAFVTILTKQVLTKDDTNSLGAIVGLVVTVIVANLIQGLIVLPALLKLKGISPKPLFFQVKEALAVAFFSRSSAAALPLTLETTTQKAGIRESVAKLSLPLCTTINMNGCSQFILLSTYFVSYYTGNEMDLMQHVAMIFLSVVAAVGNAGVPMGCFFLASSILAANNVPLYLMGSILPLYTFIDMVETGLNVWSDVSITKIVDKEIK